MRLLLLAVLLAGCFGGGSSAPNVKPQPAPPRITATPGITVDPALSDADLAQLEATGIRHLRVPAWLDWWGPDQMGTLDRFMARALPLGFQVVIVTAGVGTVCTWDETDACAAAVAKWHAELARRYPTIDALEVLNESTAHAPWDRDRGQDYDKGVRIARVLCAVRDSVKAIDPRMTIVPGSGGSAPDYLRGLKDGEAFGCLDAFVIHGYDPIPPALANVRQVTGLPVWVTEFGIDTPDDAAHLETWRRGFEQTRGVVRLYGFHLRGGDGYGVLREDGSPRPTHGWLAATFGR